MLKNFSHNAAGTLALLLPLLVGLVPQSGDHLLILVPFMLMAAFLLLGTRLLRLPLRDPLVLLLMVLWLVWGLSSLLSPIPFPSKVTWLIFSSLPLAAIITATSGTKGLWCGLTATGTLLALAALKAALVDHITRPDLLFNDSNLLGLFLALAALASVQDKRTIWALPVLLAGLIVTESRTAFLALLAGGASLALLTPSSMLRPLLKDNKTRILGAALAAALIAASLYSGFADRWADLPRAGAGRLAIWDASLTMATVHPVSGFGLGTFHLAYPPYRLAGDNSLGLMVHMEPLQMAIESGWISGLLLYALFAVGLTRVLRARRDNSLSTDRKTAAAILSALFVAMHLTYPLHSLPFLILMGVALMKTSTINETAEQKKNLALALPLALVLIASLWLSVGVLYSFLIFREVKTAFHLRDIPRYEAALGDCLTRADPDFPDCKIMAARVLIPQPVEGGKEKALSLLADAERVSPFNPEIPFLRAEMGFLDDPQNLIAIRPHLEQSLTRNPAYWPARKMLITLLLLKGQNDQARAVFEAGTIYPYSKPTRRDIEATRKQLAPITTTKDKKGQGSIYPPD